MKTYIRVACDPENLNVAVKMTKKHFNKMVDQEQEIEFYSKYAFIPLLTSLNEKPIMMKDNLNDLLNRIESIEKKIQKKLDKNRFIEISIES